MMEKVKTFSQMVDFINRAEIGIELLVPAADSSSALEGVGSFLDAVSVGVRVRLIGDREKIETVAHNKGLDDVLGDEKVEVIPCADTEAALYTTADLIDRNRNQIVLKGNLTTDRLMKGLLRQKEKVIQKGNIITHMRVFESPYGICQICDGGINVISNIKDEEKREKILGKIRKNGEEVMKIFGYPEPEVFDAGDAEGPDELMRVFREMYIGENRFPDIMLFPWIGPANIIYKAIAGTPWELDYRHELLNSGEGMAALFRCRGGDKSEEKDKTNEERPMLIAVPVKGEAVEGKKKLAAAAVEAARSAGIEKPKIALLDFTEQYAAFPDTPSIKESRILVEAFAENDACIVEGPMAFDIAASKDAAKTKKYESLVAGRPDVLFAPDYTAGAVLTEVYKNWDQLGMPWPGADISIGGAVPILIPSRSDSSKHKLRSVLAAAYISLVQGGSG